MKNIFKKNHIIITALAIMIIIAGYLSFTNQDAADNLDTVSVGNPDSDEFTEADGVEFVTNADTNDTTTDNTTTDNTTTDTENNGDNTTTDTTDEDTNAATEEEEMQDEENSDELGMDDISDDDILASAHDVADNGELNLEEGVPGEAVLASTSINTGYFIASKLEREQVRSKNREILMEVIKSADALEDSKKAATDSLIELTEISEKERATEVLLEAKGFDGAVVYIAGEEVSVVVNATSLTDQQLAIIEDIVKDNTDFSVEHINISPIVAAE